MTIKRMDNVLLVVDDLETVKAFFIELGLKLEGETTVEGPAVGNLIGLKDVRATLAMLRSPDGHGGIELDKFHTPDAIRFGPVDAPVNALGFRRVMFAVEGIDDVVARMRRHGAELIGEMQYGDTYRLAYIRGPEGIIVGLAEELGGARKALARQEAKPKSASRRRKEAEFSERVGRVLQILRRSGPLEAPAILRALGEPLALRSVQRVLRELKRKGLVESSGRGRATTFRATRVSRTAKNRGT